MARPVKYRSSTTRLLRVECREPSQGLVQRQQVYSTLVGGGRGVLERDTDPRAAALGGLLAPGKIGHDAPHHLCGSAEELSPILPVSGR
jgi:hypothetical protein